MPTSPIPVPAGPAVPDSSNTEATFDAQWEAFNAWVTNDLQPGVNALAVNVKSNADEAALSATAAEAQALIASLQATAAAGSAITAGAVAWVSDETYAIGNARFSPINGQTYRRLTAGAGTTDPSADATNWVIVNGLVNQAVSIPVNNLPAIRPSLDLDFANGQTVDPRITFTRASAATRTNARCLIEAVASGVPRIDFDPVTGACKGLLIEEQRANVLTYSEQFDNAAWTKLRATITANATTAPDGTLTADKLVEDTTASSTHLAIQSVTSVAGASYTASVFLKVAGRTEFLVILDDAGANFAQIGFAAGVGAVGSGGTATNVSGSVKALPNGWYRAQITCAIPVSTTARLRVLPMVSGSTTYTGDGTSGLFIWGAQLEAGAFPTSYIPTVASQVTRAADVATMTGANFSSWYRQDEGSFVVASDTYTATPSSTRMTLTVNKVGAGAIQVKGPRPTAATGLTVISDSGVTAADVSSAIVVANTKSTIAVGLKLNDFALSTNGGSAQIDQLGDVPTSLTHFHIGSDGVATQQNGHIYSVTYYPKRLTNSELQSLSTI